jgi:hypothetical protein
VAEVRPLRVTLAPCGTPKRVRDVSRARRDGFSGRTGGCCPHERSLSGRVPGEDAGWTLCKMCFKIGGRYAKCALKYLYAHAVRYNLMSYGAKPHSSSKTVGWWRRSIDRRQPRDSAGHTTLCLYKEDTSVQVGSQTSDREQRYGYVMRLGFLGRMAKLSYLIDNVVF